MKKIFMISIVSLLLVTLSIISPMNFTNAFQEKDPLNLLVIDNNNRIDGNEILKKIEQSRGKAIEGAENLELDTTNRTEAKNAKDYDAVAFSVDDVDSKNATQIQDLVDSEKIVYLYGKSISVSKANEILGIELAPKLNEEELRKQLVKKGITDEAKQDKIVGKETSKNESYQVVGVFISQGKKDVFLGDIQHDEKESDKEVFELDLPKYIDSIIRNINKNHLRSTSLFSINKANAEEIVDSKTNRNSTLYVGSTVVANLNGDYYLKQEKNESDPDVDYFAIDSKLELIEYNGADNQRLSIGSDLPFSCSTCSDQIKDWDPRSGGGSSWSVSLPWSISWSFDTDASVAADVSGSTTYDYADWYITKRWWQTKLVSPALFEPGTAWVSGGTYAGIDISSWGEVYYNSYDRRVTQDMDYRYSY